MKIDNKLSTFSKRFGRVVIWGLSKNFHTHKFIHLAFFKTLQSSTVKTIWLEDLEKNQSVILKGDLVLSVNVASKYLPIKPGVYYCLHNFDHSIAQKINRSFLLNLQVFTSGVKDLKGVEKLDPVTFFDPKTKTLYQPWGTDLRANEFQKPVFSKNSPFVFWVGSIWNNELNQGNYDEIQEMKRVLGQNNIKLLNLRRIPSVANRYLIRRSRVAPAIAAQWQVDQGYLPCRMFKNISYGQLGITNVKEFELLLGDSYLSFSSIGDLITKSLSFKKQDYIELVNLQQEKIKEQTYVEKLVNIFNCF